MSRLILIFLLFSGITNSQNLLPDGSFEKFEKCPYHYTYYATKKLSNNWLVFNKSTPDYFNKCSRQVGIPKNIMGVQNTVNGDGYIGLLLFETTITSDHIYKEYLSGVFTENLIKDSIYCIRLFASCADNSAYAIDEIHVALSEKKIKGKNQSVLKYEPEIIWKDSLFFNNPNEWIEMCTTYVAKGDEKYLTIGNFTKSDELNTIKRDYYFKEMKESQRKKIPGKYAYYYIDEVSVIKISDENECALKKKESIVDTIVKSPENNFAINEVIIFHNIQFEFNKAILLNSSYNELNNVINYLQKNNNVKIAISGYTDDVGAEEYNIKLSELRAKSVADYIIENGILPDRIKYYGYGSSKPIDTNETEDGRANNRRVEIIFIKE